VTRIVLFVFAGREANMRIQRPFLDRLLEEHPEAELHLWDLTRTPEDAEYVRAQASDRIVVHTHLHPGHPIACNVPPGAKGRRGCRCFAHRPPYEQPYRWYAERDECADAVFVKLDDDVVFMETTGFGNFIGALEAHPSAVISANVINNAVCAKHDPWLAPEVLRLFDVGGVGDPAADKAWWWLHADPQFARVGHEWFLDQWQDLTLGTSKNLMRSRPGERLSINCIAFTHSTMKRLAGMFARETKLGDEGAVDRLLPRIALGFRVAHLTFGPQDKAMTLRELDDLRARYAAMGKEYLGA
jgi:hypothetical protein